MTPTKVVILIDVAQAAECKTESHQLVLGRKGVRCPGPSQIYTSGQNVKIPADLATQCLMNPCLGSDNSLAHRYALNRTNHGDTCLTTKIHGSCMIKRLSQLRKVSSASRLLLIVTTAYGDHCRQSIGRRRLAYHEILPNGRNASSETRGFQQE